MALNRHADRPSSCPVLGAKLPRQPLRVAAVYDPKRTQSRIISTGTHYSAASAKAITSAKSPSV
jgi:hypothetical protein